MKYRYALVNEQRLEAQPGLSGKCQSCGAPMVAKCGEVNIWHWAHLSKRNCDPWWENKTEWHRTWQGHFPAEWQEIIQSAENGEKHIADVKTDQDWVIEFQHSYLKPDELRSREDFYKKLVWVVDGIARKRDQKKFDEVLKDAIRINERAPIWRLRGHLDECALLRDWAGSKAPVFFDFGEKAALWGLLPGSSITGGHVLVLPRNDFIVLHRDSSNQANNFEKILEQCGQLVAATEALLRVQARNQQLAGMQRNVNRFGRSRRRL